MLFRSGGDLAADGVPRGREAAGAGATEIYLANKLTDFAKTQPGLDQYAMERFAQSLEVIPRTLAENAGLKPEAIIAEMEARGIQMDEFSLTVLLSACSRSRCGAPTTRGTISSRSRRPASSPSSSSASRCPRRR